MKLNTIQPLRSNKNAKRRGRGIGSGLGKTSGKGHKGLKARSGGSVRAGFEGGQMPLQMRLPKFGFTSRISSVTDEVRLDELNKLPAEVVTIELLSASGIINKHIKRVKIIKSGKLEKAIKVSSQIRVTKGALAEIESAGGSVGV